MSSKSLDNFLRIVARTGKYVIGSKEALKTIKSAKLVVLANSLEEDLRREFLDNCKKHSVPVIEFNGNSARLGRSFGKPFRVSAISIRSFGDAKFNDVANFVKKEEEAKIHD